MTELLLGFGVLSLHSQVHILVQHLEFFVNLRKEAVKYPDVFHYGVYARSRRLVRKMQMRAKVRIRFCKNEFFRDSDQA